MRLIDAYIFKEHLLSGAEFLDEDTILTVVNTLDCETTIDLESLRPKGLWIMHYDEIVGLSCECSACHIETCGDSPYCPNCGAKMEV